MQDISVHWWLSHHRPVRWGFTVKPGATTIHEDSAACIYSLNLQLDNGCGSSDPCPLLDCLKISQSGHTCQHPHADTESMSLLQKVKSGMGSPGWNMCQCPTSTFENSCGCTALDKLEWREIIIIILYSYHALLNALSAHMIHINLNVIFYTHVEHSPTKTIYIKYYTKTNKQRKTHYKHTPRHTYWL